MDYSLMLSRKEASSALMYVNHMLKASGLVRSNFHIDSIADRRINYTGACSITIRDSHDLIFILIGIYVVSKFSSFAIRKFRRHGEGQNNNASKHLRRNHYLARHHYPRSLHS
jgi:hypothetical protein